MSELTLFYVTFTTRADAERVAETVLAEHLAACANILAPCASLYLWHGSLERAEEVPVLFKTRTMLANRLRERIAALHPYELPVVESWTVTASPQVAAWVEGETR
ncbi:divalent-cation tolerance protein CutA [Sphingomonas sp. KR3-1]|uniref:divalent-cation tolerance protein CutA n=1 Tax=Sphingomonas sp. KR3-1 TaxID=3156611 RepID=UPI0032B49854